VAADRYTPVDAASIPTGEVAEVDGTPFDLRRPTRLGDAVRADAAPVREAGGIDHNFVLRGDAGQPAAVLTSPGARTELALFTDQPGVQVYTGNKLDGTLRSAEGRLLRQGDGVALEPQRFPDTPNRPGFGSARLGPGDTYRAFLEWRFGPAGR
jgi:aldose 1-epimerase